LKNGIQTCSSKDDQHVIWVLCEKYKISENFDVMDCGSVNEVYKAIPVRFKQSEIDTIGIIMMLIKI
jgi:hypothetical protein